MKLFFTFLISMSISNCFGQDTLMYCQIYSPWVSNCYCFDKPSVQSKKGIFERKMVSDDGQLWFGRGTYTAYKHKIVTDSFTLKSIQRHITSRYVSANEVTDTKIDTLLTDVTPVNSLTFLKKGENLILKSRKRKGRVLFTRYYPKK